MMNKGCSTTVKNWGRNYSVRIKTEACGLHAEDFESDKTTLFQRYGRVLGETDYTNGIHSVRYLRAGEDIYRLHGTDNQTKIKNGKSLEGISPKMWNNDAP